MGGTSYDVAGYEEFRRRSQDPALSRNERIGFPEIYRAGLSEAILHDIAAKLPAMHTRGARMLDIGCGCGDLALAIIAAAGSRGQALTLIDSSEMLAQLPEERHVTKITGPFPRCIRDHLPPLQQFDAILAYSVLQYVFADGDLFAFFDTAVQLLSETGALLLGDIPNTSMRKRFMASASGRASHQRQYADEPSPVVAFNVPQPGQIDDAVVLGLVGRARAAGFQAFVVPQGVALPMANRREDILIRRP